MPQDDFYDYIDEPKSNKTNKKKRGALSRIFFSLFLMAVLGLVAAGAAFVYGQSELSAKGPLKDAKIVTIKRGMGTSDIAKMLVDQGVIDNPGVFTVATYATRRSRGSLKAGEFEFPTGASMDEVLKLLQAGKSLAYKVTIPEGWTTQKALVRIAANKVLKGDVTTSPAEGSLLPDTYVFQRGTTRDALVKRMQAAQTKLLDTLWDKRQKNLPVKTRAEALTLASIVERETGVGSERPKVAAVFVNRLNKKMRLQSDPTIIYGIVGGKGKMDRPISKKDIAQKTPYNTYQIDGLPPTPIANPGRAAIAAVLNPGKTDALFFVADGSGGHAFAATLKGHQANVVNWRKIEKKRKAEAAKKETDTQESKKPVKTKPVDEKKTPVVAVEKKTIPLNEPLIVPPKVEKTEPKTEKTEKTEKPAVVEKPKTADKKVVKKIKAKKKSTEALINGVPVPLPRKKPSQN